jgi:hypothetical protein
MERTNYGLITSVRPSVHIFQLENCWTDKNKCSTGVVPQRTNPHRTAAYPKIGNNKIAAEEICEAGPTGGALR